MRVKTSLRLVFIGSLLLLGACATSSWRHANKGQTEFAQDNYTCIRESAQTFPVVLGQQTRGSARAAPSTTSCTSLPGQTNCTTTPGAYTPPTSYSVDVNSTNRSRAYNACMNSIGWSLQPD